jgi:hypothetical protein
VPDSKGSHGSGKQTGVNLLSSLFANANGTKGVITMAAGDYHLDASHPIALASNTTVLAHGARFILPENLGD